MSDTDHKVVLASGDGHVGAPSLVYRDYLEKHLQPTFDEFYKQHKWRWSPSSPDSYFGTDFHEKFVGSDGYDPSAGTPIAWDSALRLKEYDRIGLACEVLHPDDQNTNDPPFGSGLAAGSVGDEKEVPELQRAGARAYNRWLSEFCSADPTRLLGLTILGTLSDPVWCVDEIQRAYDSGLTTGVLLPLEYYEPLYHHSRYDMIWQKCSELGLSITSHVSKGTPHFLGEDPFVQRFMWFWEAVWFSQRPLWCLIMGGVFEKFPDLHFNIAEIGVDWVNPLLAKLDNSRMGETGLSMNAPRESPVRYSLNPSERFENNCSVIHSARQTREEVSGEAYGRIPNLVWGADVGHAEGVWPNESMAAGREGLEASDAIAELVSGLPVKDGLDFLSGHFFSAFPNADRKALTAVADRIGPNVSKLRLTGA